MSEKQIPNAILVEPLAVIDDQSIKLMTMKQACEYLSCSRAHVYTLMQRGWLASYSLAGRRMFRQLDLDRFINGCKESPLARYLKSQREQEGEQ
jgi:excisionase family DNA binding protein